MSAMTSDDAIQLVVCMCNAAMSEIEEAECAMLDDPSDGWSAASIALADAYERMADQMRMRAVALVREERGLWAGN